ncbi:MAG: hypothetical protein AVDCRST_MAG59-2314 [uncultured Thermomicrobiales bacterium]|uniref:Response regulatory domain-containing protein n=1 Tax=uncultured Thermomicrobiales bacterium TaxID=1645740 RepID=A0A6J4USS3_9BACT|nr:MAG: hypothetical protein AVDCRST_MAG59-2314 [uncultured Thermomicrobiales bacterium]
MAVAQERPRVLVVEDDGTVRALLALVLEDGGWRVLESDHALEANDISQLRPGVVVLDLGLGAGGDGMSMLEAIRSTPGAREVPVVVCTADHGRARDGASRLRDLGASVLLKPFDVGDLLRAVNFHRAPESQSST